MSLDPPTRAGRWIQAQTWAAPATALALFAAMFSLSTFVIGPLITGGGDSGTRQPGIEQPAGHATHHPK